MRAAEYLTRDPVRLLERRHGLVEVVKRRAGVPVKCPPVTPPHPEREFVTFSQSAPYYGNVSAQQFRRCFEVL